MKIKLFLYVLNVLNATSPTYFDMYISDNQKITEKTWIETVHTDIMEYLIYDRQYTAYTEHIQTLILTTLCAFKTWLYEQSNAVFTTACMILYVKLSKCFSFLENHIQRSTLINSIQKAYISGYKKTLTVYS